MTHVDDSALKALCAQLTLEEKVRLLTGQDSWSTHPLPSIGLDSIVMSDGPAGVRGAVWDERHPSTNLPSPTAVAASWDRRSVEAVGRMLGSEAVRKGVHVVLAPTINLHRTPYGGRHFEAFSEDPVLTAELAKAYVRGIQDHGVAATLKHYIANDSETDRFTVDVRVDGRTLRELYLAAFEAPVRQAGAWLVMSSYNSINGATASENPLLDEPLVGEWGFDGVVVSDWTAVRSLESATHAQHVVMPGPSDVWDTALVDAVRAGSIDESIVDDKVIRILRLAARVGALEGHRDRHHATPLSSGERRAIARDASVSGTVLLRNDGTLPLDQEPRRVALIGEAAARIRTQGGGSATVIPERVVSPQEGLRARWPQAEIVTAPGAVVDRGLSELPIESYSWAGDPGLLVRYFDRSGELMLEERRGASRIVSFGGGSPATKADRVELHLTYRPESTGAGSTPFGIWGLCDFEVEADGVRAASGSLRLGPDDDFSAVVLNPPEAVIDVPVSGPTVELVVTLHPAPGEIPDAITLGVGIPPTSDDGDALIAEAVEVARSADVAVVLVSTSPEVESEGFDRTSLQLPGRQDELVSRVAAVNPRTVVAINAGAPVILPWIDEVAAALTVWFPGQEAGHALADVLSGSREPGGRLPMTWPRAEADVPVTTTQPVDGALLYSEGLDIGYRAWDRHSAAPAFWFGHGLGYTTWELTLDHDDVADDANELRVLARNTGARAGKVVVQAYLSRVSDSVLARPARVLVGFGSAGDIQPGATAQLRIPLAERRFSHWDGAAWAVEPGDYELHVGLAADDIRLSWTVSSPLADAVADAVTIG